MGTLLQRTFLLLAMLAGTGCATIDFDYPKTESYVITDTGDTQLGKEVADDLATRPANQSGFYPVYDGIDSLALRLLMAERAEKTIDAQYFLIHDDLVGNAFIRALLRAADRGVRVRFLIDDMNSGGYDAGFAALDAHENFELRIFNPFAHRKARALDITRASTISRRMHNKSFIVDNQMVLIGGRNIADEYFDARAEERFGDLDVLAIGSIVGKTSDMFDSYWNHAAAVPMPAISNVPEGADQALEYVEAKVDAWLEETDRNDYAQAVRSSILDYVGTNASAFTWAEYELVFDPPDKANPDANLEADSILVRMRDSIGEIQEELFVVTPYFVLRKDNIEAFRGLRDRGVDVTVLTNSLASNNHTVSHSGYKPIRKPLLEMGVEIHELRANLRIPADESRGVQHEKVTLHAKAFTVDRERLFIGSFNWNQRSANLDTESGVIIHSPKLAEQFVSRVSVILREYAFSVFLDDKGRVRWRGLDNGEEVVLTKEPQSGFWRRFNAGFLSVMPIKSQL